MLALVGALVAGVLTTLAPCVLPLLPVIVGGSIGGAEATPQKRRAVWVVTGLGVSVLLFTLLLRGTTWLIGVPVEAWSWIAGGLLIVLGVITYWPGLWDRASAALSLQERTNRRLGAASERQGLWGALLTGAALGPVFTSCSPLYGYVLVTVLPARPAWAITLLLTYVVGLCATLLVIALAGQRVVSRVRWLADPHGWFRRGLGLVFIAVGVAVALGLDRDLQAWILEHSPISPWELDKGFIPEG